jgi:hypothetical protein
MESNTDLSHQPDTVQQPPSFKPRKPIILFTAVLLIAIMAGAGGYLLGSRNVASVPQLQTTPQPETSQSTLSISPQLSPATFIPANLYHIPSTNPTLTSNWKIYKNDKYAFSFRYPPRMYANTPPYPETMKDRFSDDIVLQTKQILPDDAKNKSEQELKVLYEGVTGGDLLFTFSDKDFFHDTETLDILKKTWINYEDESIIIGGKTWRIISGNDYVSAQNKPHIRHIDIPLQQGKYLNIEYYEDAIILEEFDQILSTLKFTDH